jgi:hypothetical protein
MMSGPHISGKEAGAGDVFGQRHLCCGEVVMGGTRTLVGRSNAKAW